MATLFNLKEKELMIEKNKAEAQRHKVMRLYLDPFSNVRCSISLPILPIYFPLPNFSAKIRYSPYFCQYIMIRLSAEPVIGSVLFNAGFQG